MSYTLITAPTVEPVTAAECKLIARLTVSALDSLITSDFIPAARRICEQRIGRSLITQTWRKSLDAWPQYDDIELHFGPVQSIEFVKYLDEDGVEQTVNSSLYTLDSHNAFAQSWVLLQPDESWPTAGDYANAVYVNYVAGYGSAASDVPKELRSWIMAAVGEMLKTGTLDVPRDFCAGLLDRSAAVQY